MGKKIIFPVCNKRPERAPKIFGHVFFLCWRCTGIVIGASCMLFLVKWQSVGFSAELFVLSIASMIPMVCDGIMQYGYTLTSNNLRRFLTGLFFGLGLSYSITILITDFESIENYSVLVSSFISIVGFFATFFGIKLELRKSLKEKLVDQQRAIYTDCYRTISELGRNPKLIFEKSYYDRVVECDGELSLSASSEVIDAFTEVEKLVIEVYEGYRDFVEKNDPYNNPKNFELISRREDEEPIELFHGTEMDYEIFNSKVSQYITENTPSENVIKSMLKKVLNAMRIDIGNSSISIN